MHFEIAAEADKVSGRMYDRARRVVEARYGEADKGNKANPSKGGEKGKKGWWGAEDKGGKGDFSKPNQAPPVAPARKQ